MCLLNIDKLSTHCALFLLNFNLNSTGTCLHRTISHYEFNILNWRKNVVNVWINKICSILIRRHFYRTFFFYIMACPVPTAISNGYYVGAKVSYAAGDVIQYVCNTNYVMSGSPVTVCDVSGMWVPASGSLPECNNSYLSNSKSMPRVMQLVCNALYLHSSMNHKIQWILQFRLGVYMHVFITQKFVSTWVH